RGTIDLQTTLPDLTSNIEIEAPGADKLTVERSQTDGTPEFRIFHVYNAAVKFSGMTIAKGLINGFNFDQNSGGGVLNEGTLTVDDCMFTGNSVTSGGGIFSRGRLTVNDSTFVGNHTTSGGAITNLDTATING